MFCVQPRSLLFASEWNVGKTSQSRNAGRNVRQPLLPGKECQVEESMKLPILRNNVPDVKNADPGKYGGLYRYHRSFGTTFPGSDLSVCIYS